MKGQPFLLKYFKDSSNAFVTFYEWNNTELDLFLEYG